MNFTNFINFMLLISLFWQTGVNGLQQCYSCNSINDKNCASNLMDEIPIDCENETDICVSAIINGTIYRGCESNAVFAKECDNCQKCEKSGCNIEKYSDDGILCIQCSGNDCKNPNLIPNKCFGITECYTCDDKDGHIDRGCGNNEGSTMRCRTCQKDECNNKQPLNCYTCQSTANNPNCVQWNGDSLDVKVKQCDRVNDKCITTIVSGNTVRGCESEIGHTNDDRELSVPCHEDKCNSAIVPENRIKCHQCQNTKECSDEQSSDKDFPCATYDQYDKCYYYSYKESNGYNTVRGCFSDKLYEKCNNNDRLCYTCPEPGCNYEKASQFDEACIQCDAHSYTCPWGQMPDNAKKCGPNYPPGCFIKTHNNGTITRGCNNDPAACSSNDESCIVCYEPACNIEPLVSQVCITCNSSIKGQETCALTAAGIDPLHCINSEQLFENRGCYKKRIGDTVVRGCLADLSNDEFNNCLNESYTQCTSCIGQICNIGDAPDTAANINIISFSFTVLFPLLISNILKN